MLSETTKLRIYVGYSTNIGAVRERNEDVFVHRKVPLGYFAAIADGSSTGNEGDQVAAYTLVSMLNEVGKEGNVDPEQALLHGFQSANQYLREQSADKGSPLGSTCVAALISKSKLFVGHVGDARVYMLRGANLYALTRDHSIALQDCDLDKSLSLSSNIDPANKRMSRFIGSEEQIHPEMRPPIALAAGDVIMLCSDGLTDIVTNRMIRRVLAGATPREAAARLVEIASEKGANDNTTIIVLRLDADPQHHQANMVSIDQLKSMRVRTPEGHLLPIVDITLNPTTWSVVGLRLDLSALKSGAMCEIPVSDVGPMELDGDCVLTPRKAEYFLKSTR